VYDNRRRTRKSPPEGALEKKGPRLSAQVPASSHKEQTAVTPESVTRGEIIVNVLADGRLRVEGKMMDDAEVAKRFKSIAEKFPNQPVRIRVDKQTTYQNMVRVIHLFRKSGIVNISFANTKPDDEQFKAAHTWENVPAILVPSPPGATPTKEWRLQALIDETSLYLRFRYPEALPSVGKNLANSFEPTSKSLNQLPYIKLFVPPESLSNYAERPKATLPDGTKIYFAQVGDPKPQFGIHAGFFLRSKAPDGRQNAKSGGAFDRKDLVQGYQSVVIGIQGYVKSLKQGGKRTDYRYEGGDEPSQFVMEESGFIFIVPLAHGKGEDGQTLERTPSKPLSDFSLRVYPSGSNHFKPYIPKRISAKIKPVSADAIDKVVSGINERSSLYNWGNGVYMAVVLPKEAKPEKVVDSILSRSRDKNLDCKVIKIRKVTINGSKYWASLVTIDSIQKIILFQHLGESNGWWNRTHPIPQAKAESK
jgi:biopolymer transport protein ExbD